MVVGFSMPCGKEGKAPPVRQTPDFFPPSPLELPNVLTQFTVGTHNGGFTLIHVRGQEGWFSF